MIDRTPALSETIARLPKEQFAEHLAEVEAIAASDPAAFAELLYDWSFWGRPAQQEPLRCFDPDCRCNGLWKYWVILSGRGWGKTRTGAETVISWARKYPGCRIALIARSAGDMRGVMVEGESGLLAKAPPWVLEPSGYEPSKLRITFKNGSQCALFTAEEPDGPRGYQHHFFWADELAAWEKPKQCWDNINFGHRLPRRWDWPSDFRLKGLITTTPRPIPEIWQFKRDYAIGQAQDGKWSRPKLAHITVGSTLDNAANLDQGFLADIVAQYGNTRLGQQEIEGEILDDVPGALWKSHFIDPYRIPLEALPDQYTSVVAIDPSASDAKKIDPDAKAPNEAGIVVVAAGPAPNQHDPNFKKVDELHQEGLGALLRRMNSLHGYVMHDGSFSATPDEWARRAIKLYYKYDCTAIVAEANQGGEMVRQTLRSVDPTVPVKLVYASKNKQARAEPIVALYEQGRIHHLNPRESLRTLETQMLEWDPTTGVKSPDRIDALVWGVHYLLVEKRIRYAVPPVIVDEGRANQWDMRRSLNVA